MARGKGKKNRKSKKTQKKKKHQRLSKVRGTSSDPKDRRSGMKKWR